MVLLAGVLVLGACGDDGPPDRRLTQAWIRPGGRHLMVVGEGCALEPLEVTVEETATSVVVTSEPVDVQDGDCVSSAGVELDVALDDRPVIDGVTGRPVDVYQLPLIAIR